MGDVVVMLMLGAIVLFLTLPVIVVLIALKGTGESEVSEVSGPLRKVQGR